MKRLCLNILLAIVKPRIIALVFIFQPLVLAASDFVLPRSQYGLINLDLPESLISVVESNISGNGNYEPLNLSPPQDSLRQASSPVGRLDILYQKGVSTCTASVVSEKYLLTNYHCIPGLGDLGVVEKATILMGYFSQVNRQGTKRYQVNKNPVVADKELDFSLLEVRGNPSRDWGQVVLMSRDPYPGESLLIVHHPLGLPLHVTRGRCRAATPTAIDSTDIFHTCDTEGGSSGSPIFTSDGKGILGIHFSGAFGPAALNRGKRLVAISDKSSLIKSIVSTSKPTQPPLIVNPVPVKKKPPAEFSVDINASHGKEIVFLKSSYNSEHEMDTAGCSSVKEMLKERATQVCRSKQGTLKIIDNGSCTYTGRSVRRYRISGSAVCQAIR